MKRIITVILVLLMLAGCSGSGSSNGDVQKEEEKIYTLADGIIPYLTHSIINLEYDVIKKEDQVEDYTRCRLIKLVPLVQEGEYYDKIKETFTDQELDGELYFVSEIHDTINSYIGVFDQMNPDENYENYFWIMQDDPETKTLTIWEYGASREYRYNYDTGESIPGELSFYLYTNEKNGNRYIVDYSKMDEDDWFVEATEYYEHSDSFASKPYRNEGYMTVYDPVEGIDDYTWIEVVEDNVRVRSSPEIRDDNKLGVLKAKDKHFYFTFFLYEKTENDGYTWYRVGKKRWIASDGTWIKEYPPKKEQTD